MRRIKDFFEKGTALPILLGAGAFLGLATIVGLAVLPNLGSPLAEMRISPEQKVVKLGDEFTVEITVSSVVPVNVFAGELVFDNTVIEVAEIDYNVSVADLWAERPWFSNGAGTLNFAGGSLAQGGFIGTESLLSVRFRTLKEGSVSLALRDARILKHDGLGTEVALGTPIDAVVTVDDLSTDDTIDKGNLVREVDRGSDVVVVTEAPSTDLNNDGKQTIADVSIFMLNIAGNNERYDFNVDGKVNTKDLNILLGAQ